MLSRDPVAVGKWAARFVVAFYDELPLWMVVLIFVLIAFL